MNVVDCKLATKIDEQNLIPKTDTVEKEYWFF